MEQYTITATMADGTQIEEQTTSYARLVALWVGFTNDPDCVRLVWHPADPPPAQAAALARLPLSQAAVFAYGLAQLATIAGDDADTPVPW